MLVAPTDVSNEAQCRALVQKTIAKFGKLDMLINNAGLAAVAIFDDFPDLNLFRYTMDVNFYGAVYCTYYALPHLKQTSGRIVAISSLGGKAAIPYNTPYCASKFALDGFYNSLRMELSQHGVSVTVIYPWWVATAATPWSGFVLNQDEGGAIIGANRVDIFWGTGAQAEYVASRMKHPGMLYYLVLKDGTRR